MIVCDKCGNYITMEEPVHFMVKEMDTPDKAYCWCEECFESTE